MKIRQFLLCLVVLMSCINIGCTSGGGNLDYLQSGGRAEIEGEMDGLDFRAVIALSERGESVSIEYLAPTDLCGIKIVVNAESCEVSLGEVQFACDMSEVSGFLRPVVAFLPHGEAKSVQKEGENTVLIFPTEEKLTLSKQGLPILFEGDSVRIQVVWWQSGDSKAHSA